MSDMTVMLEDMAAVLGKASYAVATNKLRSVVLIAIDDDGNAFNRVLFDVNRGNEDAKIIGRQALDLCEIIERQMQAGR